MIERQIGKLILRSGIKPIFVLLADTLVSRLFINWGDFKSTAGKGGLL